MFQIPDLNDDTGPTQLCQECHNKCKDWLSFKTICNENEQLYLAGETLSKKTLVPYDHSDTEDYIDGSLDYDMVLQVEDDEEYSLAGIDTEPDKITSSYTESCQSFFPQSKEDVEASVPNNTPKDCIELRLSMLMGIPWNEGAKDENNNSLSVTISRDTQSEPLINQLHDSTDFVSTSQVNYYPDSDHSTSPPSDQLDQTEHNIESRDQESFLDMVSDKNWAEDEMVDSRYCDTNLLDTKPRDRVPKRRAEEVINSYKTKKNKHSIAPVDNWKLTLWEDVIVFPHDEKTVSESTAKPYEDVQDTNTHQLLCSPIARTEVRIETDEEMGQHSVSNDSEAEGSQGSETDNVEFWVCPVCGANLLDPEAYRDHLHQHLAEDEEEQCNTDAGGNKWKCPLCMVFACSRVELEKHILWKHNNQTQGVGQWLL